MQRGEDLAKAEEAVDRSRARLADIEKEAQFKLDQAAQVGTSILHLLINSFINLSSLLINLLSRLLSLL